MEKDRAKPRARPKPESSGQNASDPTTQQEGDYYCECECPSGPRGTQSSQIRRNLGTPMPSTT